MKIKVNQLDNVTNRDKRLEVKRARTRSSNN